MFSCKSYKLTNHQQFAKRITINGQKVKVSDFLASKEGFEYYRMVEGSKEYFAKLKDKEGVLIIVDKGADLTIGAITNIIKDDRSDIFKEENNMNKN